MSLAPTHPLELDPLAAGDFPAEIDAPPARRFRMPYRGAAAVLLVGLVGAAALANATLADSRSPTEQ